ncbi:hypothetical protein FF124_20225 [Martelella lutilitoris]|uniref:Biotin transporter BioY n=1 Tax=Martelella lutilitoris TaxID=2583532 RepID=A0A5C4JLQ3_9HYPH|nr:hypothetical protein [Martelella lutilitoris]TNB46034.1 hypothetical protein FF124_20225 [Martelella lutilitoris]
MSGLEQAIRKALESTDREDANQRARIYQSARQALESGLAKQGITDSKAIGRQRRRLDEIITAIEREEAEAARQARAARQPRPDVFDDPFAVGRVPEGSSRRSSAEPPEEREPSFEPEQPGEPEIEDMAFHTEPQAHFDYPASPVVEPDSRRDADFTEADFAVSPEDRKDSGHLDAGEFSAIDDITAAAEERRPVGKTLKASKPKRPKKKQKARRPERTERPPRKRGFFARALIAVVVLAFLLFGGWWVVTSNFALNPETLDTAVPNPAPLIEAEDFEGASSWTAVFQPGGANGLVPGPAAAMANVTVDSLPAVEIASQATGDAGAVTVALPTAVRGMLEEGPVLVEVSVLAPDGGGQQVGIYCADGTIDGCQRHRFTPSAHRESLVVLLDPSRGGVVPTRLMISSDLSGGGAPLDIFAIRAQFAD